MSVVMKVRGCAVVGLAELINGRGAGAGVGFDGDLVAGLEVELVGEPCGYAAGAVAADLGD